MPDEVVCAVVKERYPQLYLVKSIWELNKTVSPHAIVEFIAKCGDVLKDTGYGKVWVEISNHQQKFVRSQKDTKIEPIDPDLVWGEVKLRFDIQSEE